MVNHNYFTQRDVERLEEQAVQIRSRRYYLRKVGCML